MTRINTNVASLRGLRNLNKSNNLLSKSLTRLSTGLKINSGKDNPSGLIASETLRSQVATIDQSIKNSNRANNVISTADSALGEIGGLLNQIRGLVQEGLNDGALSQDEIEANQMQIDAALSAINKISANTTFAGDKLIDGSKSFTTQQTSADADKLDDFQINEALFGSSSTVEVKATVSSAAEKGELRYTDGGLSDDVTLEVSGAEGSQVLFFGSDSTVDDVNEAVNAVSDVTGVESSISTTATAATHLHQSGGADDDNDILFTDARATDGTGEFDSDVEVELVDNGDNSSTTSVSVNGNVVTVELGHDGTSVVATANDVISAISGDSEASALVEATLDETNDTGNDGTGTVDALAQQALSGGADGTLAFTSTNYGEKEFVDVNVLGGTFDTYEDDETTLATRDAGADIGVVINGQTAQTSGLEASVKTATLDASVNFAEANNTADESSTITITGGGSLFQIGQEVSTAGQVGLGIEAVNTARLGGISGKLYELGSSGGKSLLDVGPNVQGSELVSILEESLNRVSTLRGRLGAVQKNVIETNISTLGVALENISEARSQIIDTDFAVETANLTRGQILSQAGISTLSIANQTPQQVLSLLG